MKTISYHVLRNELNSIYDKQLEMADSMSYADQQDDESLSDDDYVVGTFGSDIAEELYPNAQYYATHEIFKKTAKFTEIPESVLFTVALTAVGDKIISDGGSQTEAVKTEAITSCRLEYINLRFGPLMHQLLNPRLSALDYGRDPVYLLWSREGSLDNQPNAWYKPNHFVLVAWRSDATSHTQATPQVPVSNISANVKSVEKKTSVRAKQGNILTFLKPAQAKPEKKGKGKADYLRNQPENTAAKRSAE
ncbi:unnamed protein product, partial [Porites evermanni]